MMKTLLIILCLLGISNNSICQRISEAGPFIGGTYYMGDMNKRHFFMSRPAFGMVHRYIFNAHFSLKNSFLYGTLEGDDSKSKNINQINRNLHFKSSILDIATEVEFNFFPFDQQKYSVKTSAETYYFSPFVFVGISLFSFNPQANYEGTWFELQPLGTEGQGTIAYPNKPKYALTQLSIPMGGGIKYFITKKITFAMEWGIRKTFTDYIDDISTIYANPIAISSEKGPIAKDLSNSSINEDETGYQRGNSKTNDYYIFSGAILTFKISSRYAKQKCHSAK